MSTLLRMAGVDLASKEGIALAVGLGEPNPRPELLQFLIGTATKYMIGGGRGWSPDEWAALSHLERAACVEAGEQLEASRAVQAATANSGPRGAAEVAAVFDGGAARVEYAYGAAMEELKAAGRLYLAGKG